MLLEPAPENKFGPEDSILIAHANQGNSIAQCPLKLDHALLSGAGVGGVSDGEVVRDLLLNGHARA